MAAPALASPPVDVLPAGSIPDGKVLDFLTGKFWPDTPEEYVRQNIEKALVRQYRYAATSCVPEFRIKVGSTTARIDVAVFPPGAAPKQENAFIVVETKKAKSNPHARVDGILQLQSYMAACANAQYGLWTNGDDRYCFAKRIVDGSVVFEEVIDIPGLGESEEDAQRPKRKHLMAATGDNLLFAFRRCHNYIAANEGMHKQEAFWELLKMIFTKIEDERSTQLQFYVTPTEATSEREAASAKARIQKLFSDKVVKRYPAIFPPADQTINLKANVVAFVVKEVQKFTLLNSPVDVKGVAYEEIVGSNLRGDRGEFFTPRNACRMAVTMLDPKPGQKILDPACGTGGFLITAMNHALQTLEATERSQWADPHNGTEEERQELYRARTEYLRECVVGLDLNPALIRAAKMNMVMNNDGAGGLYQTNSLANPHTWDGGARQQAALGSVDILFTNPPFGANIKIDDEKVLEQYDLAAVWDQQPDKTWKIREVDGRRTLAKYQPPEVLFIERCVQFLVEGTGQMAMVIPNGILNNPAQGYIRQWLLENTQVIAVVDMARDLFQPKNDTQTSMVLARRLTSAERALARVGKLDYPIFMAVAERIGHDKRGRVIYKRTRTGQDLLVLRQETVIEIDKRTGLETQKIVDIKDRIPDDELPEVARSFRKWREGLQ